MEPVKEEIVKPAHKVTSKDCLEVIEMSKQTTEYVNSMIDAMTTTLSQDLNLDKSIIDDILIFSTNDIPNLSHEMIREFLNKHCINKDDNRYNEMDHDRLHETMKIVKDMSNTIYKTKKEHDEIKADAEEFLSDFLKLNNSDKARRDKLDKIDSLRKQLNNETDIVRREKIAKMIRTMESALNFNFLYERFNKYGEKEVKSIMDTFFDERKGSYLMKKYMSKIKSFGYDEKSFTHFFNIEETFLPEKYAPFNNLFLFIYVRMIAYSDHYNKHEDMLVKALTAAMADLVYHKFESSETENMFVSVIESVLDKFEGHRDYFVQNNTTYSEHPHKKRMIAELEAKRKEEIMEKLDGLNIAYDPEDTADNLQKLYNEEHNKLVDETLSEIDEDECDTEE